MHLTSCEDQTGAQAVHEVVDEGAQQVEVACRAFTGPFLQAGLGLFGTDVQGRGRWVVFVEGLAGVGALVEGLWVEVFIDVVVRCLMPLMVVVDLVDPVIVGDTHLLHELLQKHKSQQGGDKDQ